MVVVACVRARVQVHGCLLARPRAGCRGGGWGDETDGRIWEERRQSIKKGKDSGSGVSRAASLVV